MNEPKHKVSVLMCVYNGENYLQQAIDSILDQTFKDFEFVIVNDGSTDSSWQILTEYSKKDLRIVLVDNEKNLGLEKSLNKGLAATTGEYVARQDADDISLPNRLQLQVDFLDANPKVGALATRAEFINSQGSVIKRSKTYIDRESIESLLLIRCSLFHSSVMMRRQLVQQLGGYDETMLHAEDYDLWWRISCHSCLAILPEFLLQYRLDNPHSISKTKRIKQLKCTQEISFQAISKSLPSTTQSLNPHAHEKFWWEHWRLINPSEYQNYWYKDRQKQDLLQWQDIKKLQPLWDLLESNPASAKVWHSIIYPLTLTFLRSRRTLLGISLLWVGCRQLKMSISRREILISSIEPYIKPYKYKSFYKA